MLPIHFCRAYILCWFLYSLVISNKKYTQAHTKPKKMEFISSYKNFLPSLRGKEREREKVLRVFLGWRWKSFPWWWRQNFIEANFNFVSYEGKSLLYLFYVLSFLCHHPVNVSTFFPFRDKSFSIVRRFFCVVSEYDGAFTIHRGNS